jgi:hypothetical protein
LKVGDDPELLRHDRDQKSAWPHVLPDSRLPLADPSVGWRAHDRILKLDLREPERRDGRIDVGPQLRALALQHIHLAPRGGHVRLRLRDARAIAQMFGFRLVEPRLRNEIARRQLAKAREIERGAVGLGFGAAQARDRLLDDRALLLEAARQVAEQCPARSDDAAAWFTRSR